ncbi:RPEL repeat protein [Ancylostoma duodenale]|uniref:RPEL repeat protein n=1 Tax=Ancylostoma duodenale TaxID=51022 RepID=A0A0C2H185_9BILA|nr:RPEL repeat protein [Ancylostoma duodenale]
MNETSIGTRGAQQIRQTVTMINSTFTGLCAQIYDGRVAPLIEQRARLLRQDRIRRNLSRKLEARPGPLELVTRKILQADADLEQAIEVASARSGFAASHAVNRVIQEASDEDK